MKTEKHISIPLAIGSATVSLTLLLKSVNNKVTGQTNYINMLIWLIVYIVVFFGGGIAEVP